MTIDTKALLASMPWSPDDAAEWERNEEHELDPFFTYTDRESYLAWVADWKAEYAALSARIRAEKRERRQLQRAGAYDSAAARPLVCDRRLARAMLALRRAAKRDSWARRSVANVA